MSSGESEIEQCEDEQGPKRPCAERPAEVLDYAHTQDKQADESPLSGQSLHVLCSLSCWVRVDVGPRLHGVR